MKKYWCENSNDLILQLVENKLDNVTRIHNAAFNMKYPVGLVIDAEEYYLIQDRRIFDLITAEEEPKMTPEGFVAYVNAFYSDIKCKLRDDNEIIFYDGDDEDGELFIFLWYTKEILTNEFQLLNGLLIYSDVLTDSIYASYKNLLIHILQAVRDITEEQIEETKHILRDIKEFEEMIINK